MDFPTEREKAFHDARFADGVGARPQDSFYRAVDDAKESFNQAVRSCASLGGYGLEIGCGTGGNLAALLRQFQFHAYGIDISPNAVRAARQRLSSLAPTPVLEAMDANDLLFPDETFDFCFGSGVIHHLQLPKAFTELRRVVKTGGQIVFVEPLGTNPLINLYRRLTPSNRSSDETPLTRDHISALARTWRDIRLEFYGFFTLAALPLARWSTVQERAIRLLALMDRAIFQIPGAWRLAWMVVIKAKR
jgi:SAM-dependent methyltransferase